MISPDQVPGLACPACHGRLALGADGLRCQGCLARFPVIDGIPSFLPSAIAPGAQPSLELEVVIDAATPLPIQERIKAQLDERGIKGRLMRSSERKAGSAAEDGAGTYVMTLDPEAASNPDVLWRLWDRRKEADVVVASARRTSRLASTYRRALALPIEGVSGGGRIYRREAWHAADRPAIRSAADLEMVMKVVAAGYTVMEIDRPPNGQVTASHPAAAPSMKAIYGLWKLRNSIASADYDARAYDSIVPLQRYWQRRRYRIITAAVQGQSSILDVGCGSSRILSSNPKMVGLDIQLHKLRYARRYGNPLVHGSIFALPFEDASFDCVVSSEVIEHIPAEEQVFDELSRVLKPGGRLVLGTPDYDRWLWRSLEWLYARVSPGGYADEHITHYGRANLQRYLEGRGFTVESLDYVFGAEMIFTLTKGASKTAPEHRRPVTSGLRGHAQESATRQRQ